MRAARAVPNRGLRKVVRPCIEVTPTQCRKAKEVDDLMRGESVTEASVNGCRNYTDPKVAKFLIGLGGRQRRPPSEGPEPSVRYHSGRARILTLCQDQRAK
ncbi:unnamed protein product [Fraxinus pennsylvanica]|uniref:Uncharacterized protein n=1 Tax=Fraxinus pennsylvanica TaxID=56036 RepID=A0AAD2DUR3_9LAMI|nr:unnamed protein product [Fraxinus pennsylvanica]